jgi:alkylation response protein AidB-like acyl-CoA dehydrogenase
MNFSLSEEQVMLRSMARQFATHTIEPTAMDNDRNEYFPTEIITEMARLGFLGAVVPQEYSGSGLDHISYALIIEEIARASLAVAVSVFCSHAAVADVLVTWGNKQQRQRYLPLMSKGEILGCHTLRELQRGTDEGNINFRAQSNGKQWIIDGAAPFVINGGVSHLTLVFAKIESSQGYHGIGAFLVDSNLGGFSSEDVLGKTGLRASNIAKVRLQHCQVPRESLLGNVDDGAKVAQCLLDGINFSVAASCVGASQACIDAGIKYAEQRSAFGKLISDFGMVQEMIADMIIGTETARLLIYLVGDLKNKRQPFSQQLTMARYLASLTVLKAAKHAIQIHGCSGYEKRSPVERYFRDVSLATSFGGSLLTHKLAAAQSSLRIHSA